jgi:hypothetical protein
VTISTKKGGSNNNNNNGHLVTTAQTSPSAFAVQQIRVIIIIIIITIIIITRAYLAPNLLSPGPEPSTFILLSTSKSSQDIIKYQAVELSNNG